jgi:hypothetical protein
MTSMTRALIAALALAVSPVLGADGGDSRALEVRTDLAWSRSVSNRHVVQSQTYRVIRSEKDWAAFLRELGSGAELDGSVGAPVPIDFANWMVLYIAVPSTASGSYLTIEYAWNFGTRIEVQAVEIRPIGPSCTTVGGTGPSIIALIPRADVPVYFSIGAADLDCRISRRASVR